MRIGALSKLKRTARWIEGRVAAKALILTYHRVVQFKDDPQSLSVTPQHFAEHLEILRKYTRPTALQQLLLALRDNRIQRRTVVVTFDDGYANNLYNAKPLLDRCEIPATVFVTTGSLESKGGFWQDALERLLLRPRILPETLCLNIEGRVYQWELGDASRYSEESDREYHRSNGAQKNDCPSRRQLLYDSLRQLISPLPEGNRRKLLDELFAWSRMGRMDDEISRALSPDEVVSLADGGLVEIGAHTVTHPVLSELTVDSQRHEIIHSKAYLEEILGRSVTNFAYPFGTRSDYTEQTVALVQEAGFASACSASPGVIHKGVNLYDLPRYAVTDWDGEAFEWQLARWFCD
jgi:peptidoglycan/xylan/chitin deacetylase (PgdA/CDA1 family)